MNNDNCSTYNPLKVMIIISQCTIQFSDHVNCNCTFQNPPLIYKITWQFKMLYVVNTNPPMFFMASKLFNEQHTVINLGPAYSIDS